MEGQVKVNPVRVAIMLLIVFLIPFMSLLISGRWDWWEAWVLAGVFILSFVISRALAARRNPGLLAERANSMQHTDTKSWDKVLSPIVAFGSVIIIIVAGLEARFSWSPMGPVVSIISLVVIVAGYVLSTYALVENRFFSGVVRIQSERGHQVVSGGPYRWIRHPGYAGSLPTYLAISLLLSSRWAIIPAILVTALLVLRTSLEDRTLQAELAGYSEYAKRVRYRLLPGIW